MQSCLFQRLSALGTSAQPPFSNHHSLHLCGSWVMSNIESKPGPTFIVIIWFVTWAAPEWSGLGPWLGEPIPLRVCLVHVIDPQYLCKPFDYPTWQIIVPLEIGGSSTRGMSQIWLEVRQEWRKKKEFCFVLATFRKVLSKYGDFRIVFPPNMATLRYFFKRKKPPALKYHPKNKFTARYADLTYLMNLCFKLMVPEDGKWFQRRIKGWHTMRNILKKIEVFLGYLCNLRFKSNLSNFSKLACVFAFFYWWTCDVVECSNNRILAFQVVTCNQCRIRS